MGYPGRNGLAFGKTGIGSAIAAAWPGSKTPDVFPLLARCQHADRTGVGLHVAALAMKGEARIIVGAAP